MPKLSAELREPCEPLPKLSVAAGEDLRPAILANRLESEKVHAECASRHDRTLRAVGSSPSERRAARQARIQRERANTTE